MLGELCSIKSVSGYESLVGEFINENIKDYVDILEFDALGNLIACIKGYGRNKKKIMCAAHMDEIGLQVIKLTSEGFAKIRTLGGVSPVISYMQKIEFENGTVGVVSNYKKAGDIDNRDFSKCYIDFGVNSKDEVSKLVEVGDVASFVGDYTELANNRVMSKALDNRAGCYIQIKAIKALAKEKPYHDSYFVFTVQEEIGLKGAKVVSEYIKPDIGIAIDITGSFDVPGDMEGNVVIGGGAAVKVSDASVICDRSLVRKMIECAKENNIAYQLDVMTGGGTDAGAINVSGNGVRSLGISIPTRYGHSPNSIISLDDVESCHRLLATFLGLEL
mgnify:CR=1 FL=1